MSVWLDGSKHHLPAQLFIFYAFSDRKLGESARKKSNLANSKVLSSSEWCSTHTAAAWPILKLSSYGNVEERTGAVKGIV